ncbi:MAG: hypothetical protein V3Q69_12625 [Burkholderia sp.]
MLHAVPFLRLRHAEGCPSRVGQWIRLVRRGVINRMANLARPQSVRIA